MFPLQNNTVFYHLESITATFNLLDLEQLSSCIILMSLIQYHI